MYNFTHNILTLPAVCDIILYERKKQRFSLCFQGFLKIENDGYI